MLGSKKYPDYTRTKEKCMIMKFRPLACFSQKTTGECRILRYYLCMLATEATFPKGLPLPYLKDGFKLFIQVCLAALPIPVLTLFPPKTNIFVHGKNYTFSKKGLGHKGRCYSVCIDDTCKWISHTLSRIIGPSNTATKIRVPISDTGHMAQISTANPEILINFHACSCKFT